jgi:[ribosomal protein S18]-alanine N-acetyltransferase
MNGYELRPLVREGVQEHLARLQALDRETMGEPWSEEHWLYDAPGKWELSRAVVNPAGDIVGFVVVSRRAGAVHLHRMVVGDELRGRGLGSEMVRHVARHGLDEGIENLSLKVDPNNGSARKLFERLGLRVVERSHNLLMVGRCEEIVGNG